MNRLQQRNATHAGAWGEALTSPAQEFATTPLQVLAGEIPSGLRGSLYRNGPGRLSRGLQRVGHWFDGDGAILGVHFTNAGVLGTYRYVQTAGYQAEEKADQFLFSNYGMHPSGSFWNRFQRPLKNAANTSVLVLPNRLLALWEAGLPHALDLRSLETLGLDNLQGLEDALPYSAHPKRDPQTQEIYNFGVTYGRQSQLYLYRSDRTGQILRKAALPLTGSPLIHDFVLAGAYLVFCIPPVQMQPLPVLLHLKTFSEALRWQPELGTEILVIDRETLSVVSRNIVEPWFQWHFGNGAVNSDGEIVLDLVRYENFQTNQYLQEAATGVTKTLAKGTLWQMHLHPQSGQIRRLEQVVDRWSDFPVVAPQDVGQPWRYTYLLMHLSGEENPQEFLRAIARFDYETGTLSETSFPESFYPAEPIYAPDPHHVGEGWIVTVIYDSDRHTSEVWILDANQLDAPPVCRLALPTIIPLGFHGTWNPE